MYFSLFSISTGEVTSTKFVLSLSEIESTMVAINNTDRAYLEGSFTAGVHYVKNGEIKELPPKTKNFLSWDLISETWKDLRNQSQKNEALNAARAGAFLTRRELGLALKRRSILTQSDAVLASRGEWPSILQSFWDDLNDLDPNTAGEILIEWAGSNQIYRTDPNILTVASLLEITFLELDEIFLVSPD